MKKKGQVVLKKKVKKFCRFFAPLAGNKMGKKGYYGKQNHYGGNQCEGGQRLRITARFCADGFDFGALAPGRRNGRRRIAAHRAAVQEHLIGD